MIAKATTSQNFKNRSIFVGLIQINIEIGFRKNIIIQVYTVAYHNFGIQKIFNKTSIELF